MFSAHTKKAGQQARAKQGVWPHFYEQGIRCVNFFGDGGVWWRGAELPTMLKWKSAFRSFCNFM